MKNGNDNNTTIVLALVRYSGVNPRTFENLLKHFSSLEELLEAEVQTIEQIEDIAPETAERISQTKDHLQLAGKYYEELAGRDIVVTTRFDSAYPQLLFELNDPPPLLYSRGKLPDNNLKTIALVGAEEATNGGIALTSKIANACASEGVQIISSIRRGIDTASHLGSKAINGPSFAVLNGGFDNLTAEEEMPLVIDIVQTGGVISEYAPDEAAKESNYSASNRIIVGLAQAVVVMELYQDSKRVHDLLEFCRQIGKLTFIVIDPEFGALSDESSLALAIERGAILMEGRVKVDDIIKSLV